MYKLNVRESSKFFFYTAVNLADYELKNGNIPNSTLKKIKTGKINVNQNESLEW